MSTPSPKEAAAEGHPGGDKELWKITLGELDEKMGVRIIEESVQFAEGDLPQLVRRRRALGSIHG